MPCLTGKTAAQYPLWVCLGCGRSPERYDGRGRGHANKRCKRCKKHLRLFIGPMARALRKMRYRTRGRLLKKVGVWYMLARARRYFWK